MQTFCTPHPDRKSCKEHVERVRRFSPGPLVVTRIAGVLTAGMALVVLQQGCGDITAANERDDEVAVSLTIEPEDVVIGVGRTGQIRALPVNEDGQPVSGYLIQWASSAPDVAAIDGDGRVTGVSEGSALITATAQRVDEHSGNSNSDAGATNLSATIEVVVDGVEVASVEVIPSSVSVLVGDNASLKAVVRDAENNVLNDRLVEWKTSNPSIVVVDESGVITGEAEGTATVSATSEGKSDEANVRVSRSTPPDTTLSAADTFYVAPDGDDSNPGTEAQPWRTIRKATETLQAHQMTLVKQGTYVEAEGCNWTTPALNPVHSGSPDAPIILAAYPGHRPLVTNSVSDEACPVIGASDRAYIVWSGFEVEVPGFSGVAVFTSQHIVIQNNEIHGLRGSGGRNTDGIRVEESTDIVLQGNRIYDIRNSDDSPNGAAVKMYDNFRVLIERNEAFDVGAGLRNKDRGGDNVWRYNYVHHCTSYGIEAYNTTGAEIYGNIVHDCGTGINIGEADAVTVYNNTLANISRAAIAARDGSGASYEAWNNVLYRAENRDMFDGNSSVVFCGYNLFFESGQSCGSNNVLADPLFVGPLDNPDGFKLQDGSPAIGAGRDGENIGAYVQGDETIGPGG